MFYLVLPLQSGDVARLAVRSRQSAVFELDRKERIDRYYTDKRSAEQEAERLAVLNPSREYAVMSVERIYVTTTPKIIKKIIGPNNELVVEKSE